MSPTQHAPTAGKAMFGQVTIVGVGLLGGSIGAAVRERKLAQSVVGVGRDAAKLQIALKQGLVDRTTTDLAEGLAQADLVIVATPVELVAATALQALQQAPAGCLVTDVGSTKETICREIWEQAGSPEAAGRFVGSHPLAGDHRAGAQYARADLLVGRTVVVTPNEADNQDATAAAVKTIEIFWRALGAEVVQLSAEAHDAAVAVTSHVPHLIASAIAGSTPRELLSLAATGWKDTTRIAAADPSLWRQIFLANRGPVLAALDQFDQHLASLRASLAEGNGAALEQLLAEGKQIRDALGN